MRPLDRVIGHPCFVSVTLIFVVAVVVGCGTAKPGAMNGPTIDGRLTERQWSPLESADILRRTRIHLPVSVKHILIGWDDLEDNYQGAMDSRAKARDRFAAEDLIRELERKLNQGVPMEVLMIEHSEDRGSADGRAIKVTAEANLVPGFVALSTRLENGEIGIVRTLYGYHLIKRVK